MMNLIMFILGICLGGPLSWALFLLLAESMRPKRPPTKEEWKVM